MTFSPASYVSATTTPPPHSAASSTETVLECLDIACYLLFIDGCFAIKCGNCGENPLAREQYLDELASSDSCWDRQMADFDRWWGGGHGQHEPFDPGASQQAQHVASGLETDLGRLVF